jgi:hypothetical protein
MLTASIMKRYDSFLPHLAIYGAERGLMKRYDYFLPLLATEDAYRRYEETTWLCFMCNDQ